jgi:hypothetical protein
MNNQYKLLWLVYDTKLKYSEWIKLFDQIIREIHNKDKETVDLAFELYRRIQSVYGYWEYEGEVTMDMDARDVLTKLMGHKQLNQQYVNMVLTRIDQQLGRRGLHSRFKKLG